MLAETVIVQQAIFWDIVWIVLIVTASMVGAKLLAPDVPEDDSTSAEGIQSRIWRDQTTQLEGLPRARNYGQTMHHGNILCKWTDIVDHRELLYLMIDHGDGPVGGIGENEPYFNDQPASNFEGVTVEERTGTMDQTVMEGFEVPKLEYVVKHPLVYNVPWVFTTPNDFFDDIEVTMVLPNGVSHTAKSGGRGALSVPYKIRTREHSGPGEWEEVFDGDVNVYSAAPYFIKFVFSDYVTITNGLQQDNEFTLLQDSADRLVNDLQVRSIREVVDIPFEKQGKALIGITALATAKLSGDLDIKIVSKGRIIAVYDDEGALSLEYSANRAWVAYDLLTQPVIVGNGDGIPYAIARYEGLNPEYIDLDFFYEWSVFAAGLIDDGYGGTEPRSECHLQVKEFTPVFDLVNDIANSGRAHIYWKGDKLSGWLDAIVDDVTDLVTMDTIMSKSWKNAWTIKEEMAGIVEIVFDDSRQGYESVPASYSNSDAGGYTNSVSLEGLGITTRGAAIHLAAYHLERINLITNVNQFRIAKSGFRYELGNVIRLQCRMANWGKGFRVVNSPAYNSITVDRDAEDEVNVGDAIHIRSYGATPEQVVIDTYEVATVSGRVITCVFSGGWDVEPKKGNLVAIGPAADIKLRRITKIDPTEDNYFNVTVETYNPDLFDTDLIDPSNPNANFIWPGPRSKLTPPITRGEVEDIAISHIGALVPNFNKLELSNVTWGDNDPSGGFISWSETDAEDDIILQYKGVMYLISENSTSAEFIYWDISDPTVFNATNTFADSIGTGKFFLCHNNAGVAVPTEIFSSIYGALIQAGTITAEYAQIADAAITSAKIDDLAVTDAKIGNLQVKTAKIDNLSVGTTKLTANAGHIEITGHNADEIVHVGSWIEIMSLTIPSEARVIISASSCGVYSQEPLPPWSYRAILGKIRIQRDGTTIAENNFSCDAGEAAHPNIMSIDQPGAGNKQYDIDIYIISVTGTHGPIEAFDIDESLLEHKGK